MAEGPDTKVVTRFNRWRRIVQEVLAETTSESEAKEFHRITGWPSGAETVFDRAGNGREFLNGLKVDIQEHPERVLRPIVPASSEKDIRISRQGVFFKDQYFDAFYFVGELLESAEERITIVDDYPKEPLLKLLSAKKKPVPTSFLAQGKPNLDKFKALAESLNKQYGSALIELRTSATFHDRFVILDDKDCFHFGASLADVGKKGFMFSVIEDPTVKPTIMTAIAADWRSANVLL